MLTRRGDGHRSGDGLPLTLRRSRVPVDALGSDSERREHDRRVGHNQSGYVEPEGQPVLLWVGEHLGIDCIASQTESGGLTPVPKGPDSTGGDCYISLGRCFDRPRAVDPSERMMVRWDDDVEHVG
jgi:hypothetical protein